MNRSASSRVDVWIAGAHDESTQSHAITAFHGNTNACDADGQQSIRTIGGTATTISWDRGAAFDSSGVFQYFGVFAP